MHGAKMLLNVSSLGWKLLPNKPKEGKLWLSDSVWILSQFLFVLSGNRNWGFNYWGMHPVACVLIKYRNNLRTQQSIFLVLDFIVHFSHYIFQPRLAAIFRWFANTKYLRQSLYIKRIRWVGMYKVNIVVR
jgi:hypothetical protein